MSEPNRTLVTRLWEQVWNEGRLEVIDEVIAVEWQTHDAANPGVRGREGLQQLVTKYRTAFPDLHFAIEDMVAIGDKVVTRWHATGTHLGPLDGLAPTGQHGETPGITIDRIVDGRIHESWTSWDTLGLLVQIGAVSLTARPPTAAG
ncbi:MAG: ester cyclase [Acidobacteria bacterium]|nr:ester cyclase [Acidobacteriota bacterium]